MTTTNEIKRVSDREFEKAFKEMCQNFSDMTNGEFNGLVGRIEFFFDYDRNAESAEKPWNRPKVMQINWAAIGTVMPEEAAKFGKALMVAAKLAENFIYNGYKVYYED